MEGRRATRLSASDTIKSRRGITTSSPPPAVTRKSPSRRSPARKSPPRKSPARKSPARKSPARKISPARPASAVDKKTTKLGRPKKTKNVETKEKDPVVQKQLKVSLSPLAKSPKKSESKNVSDDFIDLHKRSSAARAYSETKTDNILADNLTPSVSERSRQSGSRSMSYSVANEGTNSDFSDAEVEGILNKKHSTSPMKDPYSYLPTSEILARREQARNPEFSGNLGSLVLILILSLGAYFVQYICTRQECGCSMERLEKLKSINVLFNLESASLFFGFIWTVILMAPLPLGRRVTISNMRSSEKYNFNGFGTALTIIACLIGAEYYDYPVIKLISRNFNRMLSLSIVYALVTALWLYPRIEWNKICRSQNPYAKCSGFIYKYFVGREFEPKWYDLINVKLAHIRIALISTLIFSGILIFKNLKFVPRPPIDIENATFVDEAMSTILHTYYTASYNTVALILACLTALYQLDALINEHHLANSFEMQQEGLGAFALLRYAIYPHLNCLMARYMLEHPITNVPTWALALMTGLFLCGLCLKRYSNSLKYALSVRAAKSKCDC